MTVVLILAEQLLVLFVQEVANFLQHGNGVGVVAGMLAKVYQLLEQLVNIGHVEVARQHQRARFPVVGAHHGVYVVDGVVAESAVAQVS